MTAAPFDRRALPAGFAFSGWRAPDGWPHRRFDWAGRGRGSMLFLTGRADFAEKYLEAMAHLHGGGWGIAGFDWRGQGGSGRILAGQDLGHLGSLDPLVGDLSAFAADWIATTPGPHVVVAHSMGGHVLLRALAERRAAFDAAVLVAPMLGLATPRIGRLVAFLAGLLGRTMTPIGGVGDGPARQRRLTGSAERHADAGWWRTQDAALTEMPPSWGWLHAAYDSIARLDRADLSAVTVPVLAVATKRDRLVAWGAIARMVARLADGRVAWFDGAHELLREADPVRCKVLATIDAFLDERAVAR